MDPGCHRGGHDLIATLLRPLPVHLASLLVGLGALVVLGRDQWFSYDDWANLHPGWDAAGWLAGHQGHWNTAATLVFQVLRATVGLHSYLPYLALAFLAHLAVVHLLWRVMLRSGVRPWLATGLAAAVIFLGSAAENLLWAFQFGFVGAIALGLLVMLLVDRQGLGIARVAAIVILSVASLTFSGTALPLIAAALVLSWIRRGWWRSLLLFAPAGLIYLAWLLAFSGGTPASLAPHGVAIVTAAPVFFAAMFAAGYGQFVGVVVLGPLVAIALAAWLVTRFRHWRGTEAIAYALLLGSGVFAVLTAASRSGGELSAAGAQRYVYVIVALALPTMGLALGWVASRGRAAVVVVTVAIALVGAVNVVLLVVRAGEQATTEQRVQREVSAALSLAGDQTIPDGALPVIVEAPDLTMRDLRSGLDDGIFSPVPFEPADLAAVRDSMAQTGG
ncbi:MAG: hypothetical protein ABIQ01_12995 [Pseudolysinimonas sp.]